jgi:RNA polymerase sigma factor (sigma-70 family)
MNGGTHNRQDLEGLYLRYGAMVLRRAQRILGGDEQGARDVCHDVFVEILRAPSWAPPSPVAWLYVATTNRCLNVLRSDRRRRLAIARLPTASFETPLLEARLLLSRIPEALQEIAIYYAVDRMSQQEIALVLGTSQKTISNRVRELREILEANEPEPQRKEVSV